MIEVDGPFAGFVLTFASGAAYDGENFAWFAERYADFCYLDRVVIHEDFRRRGLGSRVYDELEAAAAGRCSPSRSTSTRPTSPRWPSTAPAASPRSASATPAATWSR